MAEEHLKLFGRSWNNSVGNFAQIIGGLGEEVESWLRKNPSYKIVKEETLVRTTATESYAYAFIVEKVWYEIRSVRD